MGTLIREAAGLIREAAGIIREAAGLIRKAGTCWTTERADTTDSGSWTSRRRRGVGTLIRESAELIREAAGLIREAAGLIREAAGLIRETGNCWTTERTDTTDSGTWT